MSLLRLPIVWGDILSLLTILPVLCLAAWYWRHRFGRRHASAEDVAWVIAEHAVGVAATRHESLCRRRAVFDSQGYHDMLLRCCQGRVRILYVYARPKFEYVVVWLEQEDEGTFRWGPRHCYTGNQTIPGKDAPHVTLESYGDAVEQTQSDAAAEYARQSGEVCETAAAGAGEGGILAHGRSNPGNSV